MHSKHPVAIEGRALDTLKYIRSSMDAAGSLAVPGAAGFVMGATAIAAGALVETALKAHWVMVWLLAAAVALPLAAASIVYQSRRNGRALYSGPTRRFLLCLCPTLVAGAIFTVLFLAKDLERFLPGAWLLLYGASVLSASVMTQAATLRLIAAMGASFMLFGGIALALPAEYHNLVLSAGFGGLHLLFGVLIGRANHGD